MALSDGTAMPRAIGQEAPVLTADDITGPISQLVC